MSMPFTNKDEWMTYGQDLKLFLPEMGELQSQLYEGEYDPFKYAPVFESNFVQVTKKGEAIDIHNQVTLVTLGIAATSPILPLPNVMLLARPKYSYLDPKNKTQLVGQLQLSRLFPLKLVRLSVSNIAMRQIKLKLASGRSFYLQLHAPPEKEEDLFQRWMRLIYLLQPTPSNSNTARDYEFMIDSAQSTKSSDEKKSEKSLGNRNHTVQVTELQRPVTDEDLDEVSIRNDAALRNLEISHPVDHEVYSKSKKELCNTKKEFVHPVRPSRQMPMLPDSPPMKKKIPSKMMSPSYKKPKGGSIPSTKKLTASPVKQKPSKLKSVIKSFSKHDTKEPKKKKK